MKDRHQSLALATGLGIAFVVLSLTSVGSAMAEQGKVVLAQIVNDTRSPVPVVNVGGGRKTVVVLDQQLTSFTEVDVSAFRQIRVLLGVNAFTPCEVSVVSKHGGVGVFLGTVVAQPLEPATGIFELPGTELVLGGPGCNNHVVVLGR